MNLILTLIYAPYKIRVDILLIFRPRRQESPFIPTALSGL